MKLDFVIKSNANVSGILVTLRSLFENMKFDHVIYFPSAQSELEKNTQIGHLALQDSLILERSCIYTTPLDPR